eukprot:GHVU01218291.1.p2 GENE.GHVU01218291.1~~GHVU01218291.1.p2  ORF type:complete len:120 (+),score=2.11 GHVU01218291.1:636-995(+)
MRTHLFEAGLHGSCSYATTTTGVRTVSRERDIYRERYRERDREKGIERKIERDRKRHRERERPPARPRLSWLIKGDARRPADPIARSCPTRSPEPGAPTDTGGFSRIHQVTASLILLER